MDIGSIWLIKLFRAPQSLSLQQAAVYAACLIAAWAEARRAIGTRNGEQLT